MGERLKQARKSAGKTQLEVASAIGVAESTYCCYETGKRRPSAVKLAKIAGFLGVSGDFLLGRTDNPAPVDLSATYAEERLLGLFRSMSEKDRAVILATAEALAK